MKTFDPALPQKLETALARWDRGVHLRPPGWWSRGILWAIIGSAVFALLWMTFAQIDEVVAAAGKLEPTGAVREIQTPIAGVIETIYVTEGQFVHQGQPLVRLDQKVTAAQVASLEATRVSLKDEMDFYLRQMSDAPAPDAPRRELPEELLTLARDRANLAAENRLFRAQLRHSAEGFDLPADQAALFEAAERDRESRQRESALAREQAESQLAGSQNQLVQIEKLLANNRKVLDGYTALASKKVVSEVDRLAREGELLRTETEAQKLGAAIVGLQLEVRKNRETFDDIEVAYRKEALAGLEKNAQRIAEIDSRLSKAVVDDRQRLSQIDAQLAQARASIGYQELLAPADGVVLDVRPAGPGSVVPAGETLLKIVPGGALVAKVFLSNKDIGFVREGMAARVRVDAFPFREFGDLGGRLTFVGSDALPPTQTTPFYSFPAKVQLDSQFLRVHGKAVRLQSGMAVTINLQVRQRRVLSLLLDMLLRPTEKLGEVH